MSRRKLMTVDVTDELKQICAGAGIPWNDAERFVVPVGMWRRMKRLLRLDDYIADNQDGQDAGQNDTQA